MALNRERSTLLTQSVMGLVILLSICAVVAGIIMWRSQDELDQTSLLLILFGALVTVFMFVGITFSNCFAKSPPPMDDTDVIDSDPPPTYRYTWRIEYLKSGAAHATLVDETDRFSRNKKSRRNPSTKRDIRTVWTTMDEAGVHSAAPGHIIITRGPGHPARTGRSNTVPVELEGVRSESVTSSGSSRGSGLVAPGRRPPALSTSFVPPPRQQQVNSYDDGLPTYEDVQRW